MIDKIFKPP